MPNKNVLIVCPDKTGYEQWIAEIIADLSPFSVQVVQTFVQTQHQSFMNRPDAVIIIDSERQQFQLGQILFAIRETCPQAALALMSSQHVQKITRFEMTRSNVRLLTSAVRKALQ